MASETIVRTVSRSTPRTIVQTEYPRCGSESAVVGWAEPSPVSVEPARAVRAG